MENLTKRIEALLFIHGEPMALDRLSKLLGINKTEIRQASEELDRSLSESALTLVWHNETIQLATRPQFAKDAEVLIKEEISPELSRASAEALTVIAYRGPLSRSEIDYIRGVNSSYILRNLLIRGLIERATNSKDSRIYLYKTSIDFLKYLGLSRIEDLPQYGEFKNKFQEFLSKENSEHQQQ